MSPAPARSVPTSSNSSSNCENLGQSCNFGAPIVSKPAKEVEVSTDYASNMISSKLPQGEKGAKSTVVEEVAADNLSDFISSQLPQEEVRAYSSSDGENNGQSCNAGAPIVSEPANEVEVAAANVSSIISSKLPQGEVRAKPTVAEEVGAGNVSNFVSSKLPREEVGANALPDDENHGQSCKLGLTEMINMGNDDSGEDEVESSTSLVSVGIYKVKKEAAGILEDILEKHGNIAAGMPGPVESRAYFLVQVCDFVQMLYQKKFADITQADIESLLAIVSGLEASQLELGWLRKRIEQIQEAKRVMHDYPTLEALEAQQSEIIRESHQAIEETEKKMEMEYKKLKAAQESSKMISERVDTALATINRFSK